MTTPSDWRAATRAVHSGRSIDDGTGAVVSPIHLSTTFARGDDCEPLGPYIYGRYQNPNRLELEACVADLEGGAAAAAFASGSAAANGVLQSLAPGTRVRFSSDLYHGVRILMESMWGRAGLDCQPFDVSDDGAREAALSDADVVWCETPSNPQLRIVDLRALAARCAESNVTLIVDNTFATPLLQRPLEMGADLVVHSTTKYLAGHSDVTGGAVVARTTENPLWDKLLEVQRIGGAVPSPFDCWLTLRGIATLAVRIRQHCDNAEEIARRLSSSPRVAETLYPGLASHLGHSIAAAQMTRSGGMLSFRMAGGEGAASAMVSRLQWIPRATSLGGVHTLVEHRALVEPEGSPVPPDLIRVSVGIEDVEDIWADLEQAVG